MKKSQEKPKFQEESFLDKLPLNPKILISIIAFLILVGGYFLLRGDPAQLNNSVPILANVKGDKKQKAKTKVKKDKK